MVPDVPADTLHENVLSAGINLGSLSCGVLLASLWLYLKKKAHLCLLFA